MVLLNNWMVRIILAWCFLLSVIGVVSGQYIKVSYMDNLIGLLLQVSIAILVFQVLHKPWRWFLVGCIVIMVLGNLSNIIVGVVNGGEMPVFGYTKQEFIERKDQIGRPYFVEGNSTHKLACLADSKDLGGGSIGDCILQIGEAGVVITIIWLWRVNKRTKVMKGAMRKQ